MTISDLEKPTYANDNVDMTPQVRVVDADTGKVAYFYTPQQLECHLRKQNIIARVDTNWKHEPPANNSMLASAGCVPSEGRMRSHFGRLTLSDR